jgi:opacity protein-like surface antigen
MVKIEIMKRFLRTIIILIMAMACLPSHGQGKLRFNVHLDPQLSWFSSSDHDVIDPDGSIFHMQAGIQMDYYFQENYAFVLGFGINNMGGSLLYGEGADYLQGDDTLAILPDTRLKMNLQYLDIPVGLKLKTEELGYATIFLQLGFNPMFNISAHVSSKDGEYDKDHIEDSINLFNLGYHVGAGIEYRLGGNTAVIGGIRWTDGLTNITENDGANLTTNAISLHLGILF